MASRPGLRSSKRTSAVSASPIISVLGGLNFDLVYETERFPVLGESINAQTLHYFPGGKGLNTAIAAYRASHNRPTEGTSKKVDHTFGEEGDIRIFMGGAVGDDEFGQQLRQRMEETNINSRGVSTVEGQKSGTCVVIVEPSGESRNVAQIGANAACARPSRVEALAGGTGSKPDLFITNLGVPLDVVEYSLKLASNAGVETILNPSAADYLTSDVYPHVSHLVVNESETAVLSGRKPDDVHDWEKTEQSAKQFIDLGVRYVILTLGGRGAYYTTREGETDRVPAVKVNVKDSTGAGYVERAKSQKLLCMCTLLTRYRSDSFLGAYAVELIRQRREGQFNIRQAITVACAAASKTIQEVGAQEALPWADEIDL